MTNNNDRRGNGARGVPFARLLFVALVIGLCLALLQMSPKAPLLSDQLVTPPTAETSKPGSTVRDETQPESIGSTPAPALTAVATADAHPLDPVLRIAYDALRRFEATVDDYTGIIIKRERIGGTLSGEARMEFKILAQKKEGDKVVRPLNAYLKFSDPWVARGREVIWAENANDGKLVAHEGGLKNLVRISLAPTDTLAMLGNKYPITDIGIGKLVEKLIEKGERDRKIGPCQVRIEEGFKVGDVPCQKIEVVHADPDPRFDFHKAEIFIDPARMIPLRYAAYLWPEKPGAPPPLEEEYTYIDVKLNVGLKESDFDPNNPAYNYPK